MGGRNFSKCGIVGVYLSSWSDVLFRFFVGWTRCSFSLVLCVWSIDFAD